ncbi:MAG: 2'-5' RNA ligase family protein [Minisyncoccia bacterium]
MKNRYFIAVLPEGHLPQYHRALSENLSKKFDVPKSRSLLTPHITLKAPFEASAEDLVSLKRMLALFSEEQSNGRRNKIPFWIKGYGHLGRRVITLDVVPSLQMVRAVSNMQERLSDFPWMTWGSHEPIFHFHVTLLNRDLDEKFDVIWDFLQKMSPPKFDLLYDNIALLRKEETRWIVDTIYRI